MFKNFRFKKRYILILFVLYCVFSYAKYEYDFARRLDTRILEAFKSKEEIYLKNFTDFDWDVVCFMQPYSVRGIDLEKSNLKKGRLKFLSYQDKGPLSYINSTEGIKYASWGDSEYLMIFYNSKTKEITLEKVALPLSTQKHDDCQNNKLKLIRGDNIMIDFSSDTSVETPDIFIEGE
jgi:hypothetical protein